MRRSLIVCLVLATQLLSTEAASAWGKSGHRIVCAIALERLGPEARQLVSWLQAGESKGFPESCLWADRVRDTTHQETTTFHYLNVPAGSPTVDLERDCPEGDCVPRAIERYARELADTSADRQARNEALKFLAHFVGDAHQPLHCGRLEDRGGNDIETCFFGDCGHPEDPLNLHRVWDIHILRNSGLKWRHLAENLAVIDYATAASWLGTDAVDWATESYEIAEDFAYPELPPEGVRYGYYVRAREIVERRLQQAAVRLADLLDQIASSNTESGLNAE